MSNSGLLRVGDVKRTLKIKESPIKSVLMDTGVAIPEEGAILKMLQ